MRSRDKVSLLTAANLLLDEHLVWSGDLESIRKPLAKLLSEAAKFDAASPLILEIADKLLMQEYDLTI